MDYLGKSKKKGVGDERETPDWLFHQLNNLFKFQLDVAASPANAKCREYYTKKDDALSLIWFPRNFMNPPFSMLPEFTQKAYQTALEGKLVVGITPLDPTTEWWQRYVKSVAIVWSVPVRVDFGGGGSSNPLPIAVVIWSPLTVWPQSRWRQIKAGKA